MPKRKRDHLQEKLETHSTALFRAVKLVKGYERQRMAKRLHDPRSTPEKRARIEKEILVLKSLDLHSVAHAHLCSALLKIKAVVESPKLPDEVRNGVPKPEISEEERVALHNVTSGLYNQPKVRETLDAAIVDICRALHVPVPEKRGRLKKGDNKDKAETRKDPEQHRAGSAEKEVLEEMVKRKDGHTKSKATSADVSLGDESSEWKGISEGDEVDDEIVEKAISRFEDRLGRFDSDNKEDEETYDTANEELDPMEITDESATEESEDDEPLLVSGPDENGSSESEDKEPVTRPDPGAESGSHSNISAISPPPKTLRKDPKKIDRIKKEGGFLPSLMAGYISGSESEASDIDVAPPQRKNRRGQRARRAIWEKKYKDKAKHLSQEKAGRDSGWDLKRGAVDGSERTPWKKGIKTPFARKTGDQRDEQQQKAAFEPKRPRPPTKKDDDGPLHPSWEARKKAKEAQETAHFQGKRITFE